MAKKKNGPSKRRTPTKADIKKRNSHRSSQKTAEKQRHVEREKINAEHSPSMANEAVDSGRLNAFGADLQYKLTQKYNNIALATSLPLYGYGTIYRNLCNDNSPALTEGLTEALPWMETAMEHGCIAGTFNSHMVAIKDLALNVGVNLDTTIINDQLGSFAGSILIYKTIEKTLHTFGEAHYVKNNDLTKISPEQFFNDQNDLYKRVNRATTACVVVGLTGHEIQSAQQPNREFDYGDMSVYGLGLLIQFAAAALISRQGRKAHKEYERLVKANPDLKKLQPSQM